MAAATTIRVVIAVGIAVTIVVHSVGAIRFTRWRDATVLRTAALIFTRVARAVSAQWLRTAVYLAIEAGLLTFTSEISTAVGAGRGRTAIISFLTTASVFTPYSVYPVAVSATVLSFFRTFLFAPAIRRARQAILANAAFAHPVTADAKVPTDTIVQATEAVLA